jgi:hypothetical protein
MTQADRDAVVGRAVIAKTEAQKRLAELRAHAVHIGNRYRILAEMICSEPENIRFDEKTAIRLQSGFRPFEPLRIVEFDAQTIATLADDIRAAIVEVERTNSEAAKLGY